MFSGCPEPEPKKPPKDTEYSITVNQPTGGTISASAAKAKAGDEITLTVTPSSGYLLIGRPSVSWKDGSVTVTLSGGNYTFTMPQGNVTVSAVFQEVPTTPFKIIIDDTIQNGTVKADVDDLDEVLAGTKVTLTMKADVRYKFDQPSLMVTNEETGDLVDTHGTNNDDVWYFWMPISDVFVTAAFEDVEVDEFDVVIDSGLANGTVEANAHRAAEGEVIRLVVTPDAGYKYKDNSLTVTAAGGGTAALTPATPANHFTFEMPGENVTVTAVFLELLDVVIDSGLVNGAVQAAPVKAAEGDIVTLTVSPNNGYQLQADSLTVTKAGGGTVPVEATATANRFTFEMPPEVVTVTATFEVGFPLIIDDFSGVIGNYTASRGTTDPGWAITTTAEFPRQHLWANVQPVDADTNGGSIFGRTTGYSFAISEAHIIAAGADACIVLDLAITPAPYIYNFRITVNGTQYTAPVVNARLAATLAVGETVRHAIPLDQLKNAAGTSSLADATAPFTVTQWTIQCDVRKGLTATRLFGIELNKVQSKNITKGAVTGGLTGNDFTLPAITAIPVGNVVPVDLYSAGATQMLKSFNFSPDVTTIQGRTTNYTMGYFVMPNQDVTVEAEFDTYEKDEWVIDDYSDATALGKASWIGDFLNDTFGYWAINICQNWQDNTNSGPHWILPKVEPGTQNYATLAPPSGETIIQIAAIKFNQQTNTNTAAAEPGTVGRNFPVPLDISEMDTIRLVFRKNANVQLELGLFNGGQRLKGYSGIPNGNQAITAAPRTQTIPTVCGTGYWADIPTATNGTWETLEISLASFISQSGFAPEDVTGYGIRTKSITTNWTGANATSVNLWNVPKFWVDSIVAFKKQP